MEQRAQLEESGVGVNMKCMFKKTVGGWEWGGVKNSFGSTLGALVGL